MRTLYDILGVAPDATTEQIDAAYRVLVKLSHPDVGGNADTFHRQTLARDVLTDPDRRALYDSGGNFEDKADNDRRDALNIIQTMMQQVFGQLGDGPIYDDVVAKMTQAGEERVIAIGNDIENMRAAVVKLAGFAKRFKASGKSNVLAAMVQNKIDAIENSIPQAERY